MIDSKFLALMAATGISLVSSEAQCQDQYDDVDPSVTLSQKGQTPTIFDQVNETGIDFGPNSGCSNNGCSSTSF